MESLVENFCHTMNSSPRTRLRQNIELLVSLLINFSRHHSKDLPNVCVNESARQDIQCCWHELKAGEEKTSNTCFQFSLSYSKHRRLTMRSGTFSLFCELQKSRAAENVTVKLSAVVMPNSKLIKMEEQTKPPKTSTVVKFTLMINSSYLDCEIYLN